MSQPTIADVERELVECQQECGRLIGQLQEARAQAYEEIADECGTRIPDEAKFAEWLRSESRRIRESK